MTRALAYSELEGIRVEIDRVLGAPGAKLDPYTRAHLEETATRIKKALDASYQAQ